MDEMDWIMVAAFGLPVVIAGTLLGRVLAFWIARRLGWL